MRKRNNNKLIVLILTMVIMLLMIIYIVINSINTKKNIEEEKDDDMVENVPKETNSGYVMCNDNISPLNVRNGIEGKIIDNLFCYQNLTIEEEKGKTETCDNWFKISYQKNGTSYIGYACGDYINKNNVTEEEYNKIKDIVDKVNGYYLANENIVYCGDTSSRKQIKFSSGEIGEYLKSEYKNIDEIKKYLSSFLDDNLIKKIELSDINKPKYMDNYYMIDGNLYCRNYSNKEFKTNYINKYNFEVIRKEKDLYDINIAYIYLKENSKCDISNIDNCSSSNLFNKVVKMTFKNGHVIKINYK